MKRDWKKDRAAAVKHARLIRHKPELLAQLWGVSAPNLGPPTQDERRLARDIVDAASRETAQKENGNG